MAIKNENGNYLKINRIDDSDLAGKSVMIGWEIWLDASKRTNPTEFDKPLYGTSIVDELNEMLNDLPDATISIKNNRIAAAYKALKTTTTYEKWLDC